MLASVIDGAMHGHATKPELDMGGGFHRKQVLVQLQEYVLCNLLGGHAIAHQVQRNAEHHALVLAQERGEIGDELDFRDLPERG